MTGVQTCALPIFTYAIADNIWAELAYNYDELDSDIPHRSFERNYMSIGIGTSY